MTFVINLAFSRNKSTPYLSIYSKSSNWVKKPRVSTVFFSCQSLIDSVHFLIDNSYFCFGNLIFRQIIGVPIGVSPGPFLANLTLWYFEYNFINSLYKSDYRNALKLRNTFRLIDDISSINSDGYFGSIFHKIYPSSLVLNKENSIDSEANILDLDISIVDGKFATMIYDKRDAFKFPVVRLVPRFSNKSENLGYSSFYSHIIRCSRICNNFEGFKSRILFLFDLFVKSDFSSNRLICMYRKCLHRFDILDQFPDSMNVL